MKRERKHYDESDIQWTSEMKLPQKKGGAYIRQVTQIHSNNNINPEKNLTKVISESKKKKVGSKYFFILNRKKKKSLKPMLLLIKMDDIKTQNIFIYFHISCSFFFCTQMHLLGQFQRTQVWTWLKWSFKRGFPIIRLKVPPLLLRLG